MSLMVLSAAHVAADVAAPDQAARDQAEKKLKMAQERLDQSAREIAALTAQLYERTPAWTRRCGWGQACRGQFSA